MTVYKYRLLAKKVCICPVSSSKECIINYNNIKNVIEQYENIIVTSGIIKRIPDLTSKIQFLIVGRIDSKTVIMGKKTGYFTHL